jgi:hypothetical protein
MWALLRNSSESEGVAILGISRINLGIGLLLFWGILGMN